jgi:hypothetical protein
MSSQLLIYETAVPVNRERHAEWSVEVGADYGFSRHVNSVPLMAVEIPQAAPEYVIVFAGNDDVVMPVVILGVREDENLYLAADAGWQAAYLPAFVRRYPFVFSANEQGDRFTLCIDEAFAGFNQTGRGQRLFDEEGVPTPYVEKVLKFLQEYQAQFHRTQAFGRKLRELDLLEPMQAQIALDSGQRMSLTGFMAVDRKKLKALSGEVLAKLAGTDELELIYLHLQSLNNFARVKDRLVAVEGGQATGAAEASAE